MPLASRTPPPAESSGSQRPYSVGRGGTAGSLRACQAPGRLVWAYLVRPIPGSPYAQLCLMTICAPVHLHSCPSMPQRTCTTAHLCSSTRTPANLCPCIPPHLCPSPPAHMYLYSPAPLLPVYVLPTCTHAHLLSAHMCLSTGTPANLLPCLYSHLCLSPHAYCTHVPLLTCIPSTCLSCPPAPLPTCATAHLLPAHLCSSTCTHAHLDPSHLCPCLPVSLPTCSLPTYMHLCSPTCVLAYMCPCPPMFIYLPLPTCTPAHWHPYQPAPLPTCTPVCAASRA